MKIALLTLPVDNNFGGNLQRYALVKTLQDMGHEVVHINLRYDYTCSLIRKLLQMFKRFASNCLHLRWEPLLPEWRYKKSLCYVDKFYNCYIPHTDPFGKDFKTKCKSFSKYDVYIVGSDQVWRKCMTMVNDYGISLYFFDFLPDNQKRIAYGVSLGTSEIELTDNEIDGLRALYERFGAVSVREQSSLNVFENFGWTKPKAENVLDPTMLLSTSDYCHLIDNAKTKRCDGDMFCYILDMNEDKQNKISQLESEMNLTSFIYTIGTESKNMVSIEQWLRAFRDSKFVVTDSFHGLVFSILFHKPFYLFKNKFRGNERFDSIRDLLGLNFNVTTQDYNSVESVLNSIREKSINFLKQSLKEG